MSSRLVIVGVLLLVATSFLAGAWISHRSTKQGTTAGERKILHYVDPMHPSYTSDKPGIAPDCGMPLEPVFADGTTGGSATAKLPPGTVHVSPERLQLIGVKTAVVEHAGGSHTLRLPGRVAPDERRIYVINSTIDGWINDIKPYTTGSIVKKNQILAAFYSPEFLSATQALLFALNSMDRAQSNPALGSQMQQDQMTQFGLSLKQYRDSLRNLGMGDPQINEMIRTRKFMENVDIIAPGDGFILARNVSPGQRFDKGKELYRIADLSKVWVLVDTYGTEAEQLKPGSTLRVSSATSSRTYAGRVSDVLPQFDPISRTLKVRLEVNNPGFHLRPDMYVDVELQVRMPSMLSVPAEAVLDSGLKKTVFIEHSPGTFVAREVETGRSGGGRIEILSGLTAGERIAISGTFLLDSESRMKSAATGISGTPRQDPVCGMYIDEAKARAAGLTVDSGGVTHFFCSVEDKNRFLKNPAAKMPMPVSPAPPLQQAKPAAQMRKAGHKAHAPAAPEARPAEEHAGHQMPETTPTPQAPATPHGSGMKHD